MPRCCRAHACRRCWTSHLLLLTLWLAPSAPTDTARESHGGLNVWHCNLLFIYIDIKFYRRSLSLCICTLYVLYIFSRGCYAHTAHTRAGMSTSWKIVNFFFSVISVAAAAEVYFNLWIERKNGKKIYAKFLFPSMGLMTANDAWRRRRMAFK